MLNAESKINTRYEIRTTRYKIRDYRSYPEGIKLYRLSCRRSSGVEQLIRNERVARSNRAAGSFLKSITMKKAVLIILYIMVLFIPLSFYLKTYDSCMIKITALQIGATLLFAAWLFKIINQRQIKMSVLKSPVHLPVLLYFIWGIVSYFFSPYKGVSSEELIRLLCYAAVYIAVIETLDSEDRIKTVVKIMIITAVISVFYGLVQGMNIDPFAWKRAFGRRVFSSFGNPNFLAAYLVIVSPFVIGFIVHKRKYILSFFMVLLCVVLYLTYSKGGWLGFTAGVIAFSVLSVIYTAHLKTRRLKLVLAAFSIFLVVTASAGVWVFANKRPDSLRFRVLTWRSTIEMIKLHPVRGNGLGTFRIIYPLYRDKEIFRIEGRHQTETQHPENEFLEVASDGGVIGLGIFLWMIGVFFYQGMRKLKNMAHPYLLIGLLSSLFGLLFHNLFGVDMRFVSSGFFFWLILGLISVEISLPAENHSKSNLKQSKTNRKNIKMTVSSNRILLELLSQIIIAGIALVLVMRFSGFFMANIYHQSGIAYSKAGMWPQALREYSRCLKLDPNYVMAHYFTGNVYNDRWGPGDEERAIAKYADVKKLAPNYVMVHYQEGVVWTKLRNWEKAIESFNKAIDLDPVYAPTYFKLGWSYIQMEETDKAIKMFEKVIELNPGYIEAYVNLGNLYFMKRRIDDSEQMLLKALSLNPDLLDVHRNLGFLYLNIRRLPDAVREFEIVHKANPGDKDIENILKKIKQER